jgi:hypothetical protein
MAKAADGNLGKARRSAGRRRQNGAEKYETVRAAGGGGLRRVKKGMAGEAASEK